MKKTIPFRKLLTILAVVCLLLVSLAGCNKAASGAPTDETPGNSSVQTDPTTGADPTDVPEVPTEPEATEAPAVMGTVTADGLNVRSNPSIDSTVLNQLAINTRIVVIEQKVVGDITWGRIAEGWINMNYVLLDGQDPAPPTEPEEQPEIPEVSEGTTGTITASELNIRKSNSTDAKSVGKYKKGDKVTILETKDGWGRTDKGWISLKYVKLDETAETPEIDEEKDPEATTLVTDGNTKALGYVIVDVDSLNVRYGPGTKYDKVSKVKEGDKVAYYQEKNGWIRVKDGWISKSYTKTEEEAKEDELKDSMVSDKNTKVLGYAVITTDKLNVRIGPGTEYDLCDEFSTGKRVAYYQKDGKWIRTEEGWVSTKYAYIEGEKGDGAGNGTVTGDQLNVRTGPGTGFKSTGKLNKGDKVDILVQIKVGKTTWGYTGKGWISMEYVDMK